MAYDIVIKDGNVIDGSGMPAVRGDVAIKDGKIAARGRITATKGQIRPPIRWEAVTVLRTELEKNKWM